MSTFRPAEPAELEDQIREYKSMETLNLSRGRAGLLPMGLCSRQCPLQSGDPSQVLRGDSRFFDSVQEDVLLTGTVRCVHGVLMMVSSTAKLPRTQRAGELNVRTLWSTKK